MALNWKCEIGGRQRATLTPELEVWFRRGTAHGETRRNYAICLFGFMDYHTFVSDQDARDYVENRARSALTAAMDKLARLAAAA